jgi:hypothetical protein
MPFTSSVCALRLPASKKKPSRHPGRFSIIGQQRTIFTIMGATFFNLSGLLLKGRWRGYSREWEHESRKEWRETARHEKGVDIADDIHYR